MNYIVKLLVNIVALFFVVNIVPGISAASWETLVVAAVIIGLLNTFLRPVLILLTLPINILSIGLFTLVINGLMFWLASMAVKGFVVANFWSAFFAALIFSFASFVLNIVLAPGALIRFGVQGARQAPHRKYDDAIDVEGNVVDEKEESSGKND